MSAAGADPKAEPSALGPRHWFALRLKAHDLETPEGRAAERHRRVALMAACAGLAKLLSVVTALVSVPLALQCLGAKRFGGQGDRKFAFKA